MNKFIAGFFGTILSFCHLAVISVLGYIIYLALKGGNLEALAEFGIGPDDSIMIVVGVFVLYVLIAGFLSTIVSMHNELVLIREEIKKLQYDSEDDDE